VIKKVSLQKVGNEIDEMCYVRIMKAVHLLLYEEKYNALLLHSFPDSQMRYWETLNEVV
jgi:hypothetical protein